MESPLLNYATTTNSDQNSNLLLGLEWPSMINPFIDNQQQHQHLTQHEQNFLESNNLNETILIADRITSIQSGLLNDSIDELITTTGNQNDIVIDPDLLTLKPKSINI